MNKLMVFVNGVKAEISRVSWPSRDELVGSTIVVLIVVLIVAAVLGLMDAGFAYVIRYLIS